MSGSRFKSRSSMREEIIELAQQDSFSQDDFRLWVGRSSRAGSQLLGLTVPTFLDAARCPIRSDRSPGTEDSSLLAERHPVVVGAGLGRERYIVEWLGSTSLPARPANAMLRISFNNLSAHRVSLFEP